MLPSAEPFFSDADLASCAGVPGFFGGRCASVLAAALLLLLSLTTAARWFRPNTSSGVEKIVQQPVAPETSPFSSQTSEVTAPDPGDAPP